MSQLNYFIEHCADGFIAYQLGLQGVVVGEGDTSDEALADAISAAAFHIETFGPEATLTVWPLRDASTDACVSGK